MKSTIKVYLYNTFGGPKKWAKKSYKKNSPIYPYTTMVVCNSSPAPLNSAKLSHSIFAVVFLSLCSLMFSASSKSSSRMTQSSESSTPPKFELLDRFFLRCGESIQITLESSSSLQFSITTSPELEDSFGPPCSTFNAACFQQNFGHT